MAKNKRDTIPDRIRNKVWIEAAGRLAPVIVTSWIPYNLAALPPVVKFWPRENW